MTNTEKEFVFPDAMAWFEDPEVMGWVVTLAGAAAALLYAWWAKWRRSRPLP